MPGKAMDLITIVVQRKDGQKAVDAALGAGAPGVTYFYARGTGVRQRLGLLGMFIEAEKEVILIGTAPEKSQAVLSGVVKALELEKPGRGFAFVQHVENVVGFYGDSA